MFPASTFIVPPALRAAHRSGLARYLATGEARVLGQRVELTAVRSNGEEFPVELAITRIAGKGKPLFTGHLRDITGRKRAHEHLQSRGRAMQSALVRELPVLEDLYGPGSNSGSVSLVK